MIYNYQIILLMLILISKQSTPEEMKRIKPLFNYNYEQYNTVDKYSDLEQKGENDISCNDVDDNLPCYINIEKSFDFYIKKNFNKKLIITGKGYKSFDLTITIENLKYDLPLNYMYLSLRADNFALWANSYYSNEGNHVYDYCEQEKADGYLVSASGLVYTEETDYIKVFDKYTRYMEESFPGFGRGKCLPTWGFDNVYYCVRRVVAYKEHEEMIMVSQIGQLVKFSADIVIKYNDREFRQQINELTEDELELDIENFGNLKISGFGTINMPLENDFILMKVQKTVNSTFDVKDISFSKTVPEKGVITSSGLGEFQIVRLGSDDLLFDKSKYLDLTVDSCTSANTVTDSVTTLRSVSEWANTNNIKHTSNFNLELFTGVGNKTNLLSSTRKCCAKLENPSMQYINILWSNYESNKEVLDSKGLLNDILSISISSDNIPVLPNLEFDDLINIKTTIRLTGKNLEVTSIINWISPKSFEFTEVKVMTSSSGSYAKLNIVVNGVDEGKINILCKDCILAINYIPFIGTSLNDTIVPITRVNKNGQSTIELCLGKEQICHISPVINYITPDDGGTDDPDTGGDHGNFVDTYNNFMEYMFTGILTSILCILVILIDIGVFLIFMGMFIQVFKNFLYIMVFLLSFGRIDNVGAEPFKCDNPTLNNIIEYRLNQFPNVSSSVTIPLNTYPLSFLTDNIENIDWTKFSDYYLETTRTQKISGCFRYDEKLLPLLRVETKCSTSNTTENKIYYMVGKLNGYIGPDDSCYTFSGTGTAVYKQGVKELISNLDKVKGMFVPIYDDINLLNTMVRKNESIRNSFLRTIKIWLTFGQSDFSDKATDKEYYLIYTSDKIANVFDLKADGQTVKRFSKYSYRVYKLLQTEFTTPEQAVNVLTYNLQIEGLYEWFCSNIAQDGELTVLTNMLTVRCVLVCITTCSISENIERSTNNLYANNFVNQMSSGLLNSREANKYKNNINKVKFNDKRINIKRVNNKLHGVIGSETKYIEKLINKHRNSYSKMETVETIESNIKSELEKKNITYTENDVRMFKKLLDEELEVVMNPEARLKHNRTKLERLLKSKIEKSHNIKRETMKYELGTKDNDGKNKKVLHSTGNINSLEESYFPNDFIIIENNVIPLIEGDDIVLECDCNTNGSTICSYKDYIASVKTLINNNNKVKANMFVVYDNSNQYNISYCNYRFGFGAGYEGELWYDNQGSLNCLGGKCLLTMDGKNTFNVYQKDQNVLKRVKKQTVVQQKFQNAFLNKKIETKEGCPRCEFACMMTCSESNFTISHNFFFWSPLYILVSIFSIYVITSLFMAVKTKRNTPTNVIKSVIRSPKSLYNYGTKVYSMGTMRFIDELAYYLYFACPMLYLRKLMGKPLPYNLRRAQELKDNGDYVYNNNVNGSLQRYTYANNKNRKPIPRYRGNMV